MIFPGKFEKGVVFRFLISLALACSALVLFLVNRTALVKPPEQRQRAVKEIVADVDREVDSVLARFHLEKEWIRKKQISIPNSSIHRTERKIMIPADVLPVQINVALNSMARRYNGRAVASENLKENSVTIHVELEGYIVQTIILRPAPEAKRPAPRGNQTKI